MTIIKIVYGIVLLAYFISAIILDFGAWLKVLYSISLTVAYMLWIGPLALLNTGLLLLTMGKYTLLFVYLSEFQQGNILRLGSLCG